MARKGKHYHCPIRAFDCPYYCDSDTICGEEEYSLCKMDGNPYADCDDFWGAYGEDAEHDDYTDYVDD